MERGGDAVATVVGRTDTRMLDSFVHAVVSPSAKLVATDEHAGYRFLSRTYEHQVVQHGAGQYRTGNCHTNGIEGFWSLLKRQIVGIHHFVTAKHLDAYVGEVTWRFNLRNMREGERVNHFLGQTSGRLTYKDLIA
jgi:hypothetical protein